MEYRGLGLHQIEKSFNKKIEESRTKFITKSLRCGNRIEFKGSVVIIGDVNAGSEVVAEENIIVFGNLRGLAHAGAKGNKRAIIVANNIDTKQLRIADIIKEIEQKPDTVITKAYVEGKEIVLE